MIPSWIVSLILVFAIIPLVGLALYACLCRIMAGRDIPEPPYIMYSFLFARAMHLVLLAPHYFAFGLAGMSSIGFFYLMFMSSFAAIAFAFTLRKACRDSSFHRWACRLSTGYAIDIAALFAPWIAYCTFNRC